MAGPSFYQLHVPKFSPSGSGRRYVAGTPITNPRGGGVRRLRFPGMSYTTIENRYVAGSGVGSTNAAARRALRRRASTGQNGRPCGFDCPPRAKAHSHQSLDDSPLLETPPAYDSIQTPTPAGPGWQSAGFAKWNPTGGDDSFPAGSVQRGRWECDTSSLPNSQGYCVVPWPCEWPADYKDHGGGMKPMYFKPNAPGCHAESIIKIPWPSGSRLSFRCTAPGQNVGKMFFRHDCPGGGCDHFDECSNSTSTDGMGHEGGTTRFKTTDPAGGTAYIRANYIKCCQCEKFKIDANAFDPSTCAGGVSRPLPGQGPGLGDQAATSLVAASSERPPTQLDEGAWPLACGLKCQDVPADQVYKVGVESKTTDHSKYNQGSSLAYTMNGKHDAHISATAGTTLVFDVSDTALSSHPFVVSTDPAGANTYASTTLHGTTGTEGAEQHVYLDGSAATLYYGCGLHAGMGNVISIL